jgi:Flp pilus assembly protein TadG
MFGLPLTVFRTRGQALVELTLIFPMLIMLSLGAVEVGNLIYTYQVIHHLTAQGANIAARRDASDDPIEKVISDLIDAACPVISQGTGGGNCTVSNASRWRVIYTEIGPDVSVAIDPPYVVKEQRTAGLGKVEPTKRIW